jgi:aminopeptidase S
MAIPFRRIPVSMLLALALAACGSLPPAPSEAPSTPSVDGHSSSGWLQDVMAISAHAASADRRMAIRQLLATSGIEAGETAFTAKNLQGVNLLAPVSGDASLPLLLIGAHLDQVDVGKGATDNASGSGVVLALARRFREQPLRHHRVAVAFWDLEEKGLLGAHAYVTEGGEKPALYVNFDVFGWGDTLWMMTPDPAHPLVAVSEAATRAKGIRLSSGKTYPPTDHLAFLKAEWPAVSYSLVGAEEIEPILEMYSGKKPASAPKVMQVIHSEHDTIEQLDAAAVETGIDAVEAALRAWDAAGHD